MKLIAAALIVLAGAILFGAGAIAAAIGPRDPGVGYVSMIAGLLLAIVGLVAVKRAGLLKPEDLPVTTLPEAKPTPASTAITERKPI